MIPHHSATLSETLRRLVSQPAVPAAVRRLKRNAQAIAEELAQAVATDVPGFRASKNPSVVPELAAHVPLHTQEILRLLSGGRVADFAFVEQHARLRAEQHFPLETTLHAYRCGHKVFARRIRAALLASVSAPQDAQAAITAAADFAIEYTDAISTVFAASYVAQTRHLAEVAGDQRAQLLSILLEGFDESDGRVATVLRDAGYLDQRQAFCVALAEPVTAGEILNPARARRLADAIDQMLSALPVRRLIDLRDHKVTIVVSNTRRASGWTTPESGLAQQVAAALTIAGNAVLVGVSNDAPSTSLIPRAYREARHALSVASVSRRVTQFAQIPVREMLLHLAGEELTRVLPAWSVKLARMDSAADGALIATLEAYADANLNALKAAQALSIHPNTIYARFQKISDATGLDPRSYHALTDLLTVADCLTRAQSKHSAGRTI